MDLLRRPPLRAADAARLGAASLYRQRTGQPLDFVCLDDRLHDAARLEAFLVLP